MPYTPPPIETDLDAVTQRLFDGLATAIPGWVPVEGALDTAIVEEVGRETVTTNNQAIEAINLGVVALGETAFGLAARTATPAQLPALLTVTGAGITVPAGLVVIGTTDVGVEVAFELLNPVTTSGTTQAVTLHATTDGEVGNHVPIGPLTLATATADVVSAVATAESFGGIEAESVTDYLSRLVDFLSITRQGIVRASDMELYARNYPGVHRALAVDLYDADTDTDGVERTATVFVVAADGTPVAPEIRAGLQEAIEQLREVNFVGYVEDPTYTAVTVAFVATAEPTYDPAQVESAAENAITAFLSPTSWGSTATNPRDFNQQNAVGYLSVAAVLTNVPGVAAITSLTLNGGTADVPLAGKASLPTPVVDGTVT